MRCYKGIIPFPWMEKVYVFFLELFYLICNESYLPQIPQKLEIIVLSCIFY